MIQNIIVAEKITYLIQKHLPKTVTVTFENSILTNSFTVSEYQLVDYYLGAGNGNFQINNSENDLSGNGNAIFRK